VSGDALGRARALDPAEVAVLLGRVGHQDDRLGAVVAPVPELADLEQVLLAGSARQEAL
jgi:hypothetical protein